MLNDWSKGFWTGTILVNVVWVLMMYFGTRQ